MARPLQSGPYGLPIEIYCFSLGTDWAHYERLQANIFDHIFSVLPRFGLSVYQMIGSEKDLDEEVAPPHF